MRGNVIAAAVTAGAVGLVSACGGAAAPAGGGNRVTAVRMQGAARPAQTFQASTWLAAGQRYGVGMPIMISFNRDITNRAAVERAIRIWSSRPVTGSWYWLNDRQLWFRPRRYWPPHTEVRFVARLRGVAGAPGVYGAADLSQWFRVGHSLVASVSASTHYMKVWYEGRLAGEWPVSTGRPGDDTPDGRYLAFAKASPVAMDSATFGVKRGDPGYYDVKVYDAVQFTYDGDYVHSAPWSVAQQGHANVSHGCVNLAPRRARWYYRRSLVGDPITVSGSPKRGVWGDGWTIWFLPWRQLLAGSATGTAVRAGRHGSRFATAS